MTDGFYFIFIFLSTIIFSILSYRAQDLVNWLNFKLGWAMEWKTICWSHKKKKKQYVGEVLETKKNSYIYNNYNR